MKLYYEYLLKTTFILACVLLLSFYRSKSIIHSIQIRCVDSLQFRRSFAPLDHVSQKELEVLEKKYPNPNSNGYGNNILSQDKLNKLGLMRGDTLLLKRFQTIKNFNLKSKSGEVLKAYTGYNKDHSSYNIRITYKKNSAAITLTNDIQEVKFAFVDFIHGGFNEIVILREYHIMNGDNYYIQIYEARL